MTEDRTEGTGRGRVAADELRLLIERAEPLLGPVTLGMAGPFADVAPEYWGAYHARLRGADRPRGREQARGWVVLGGESGPGARPMHPAWARTLRDQCRAAGVPWAPVGGRDDDEALSAAFRAARGSKSFLFDGVRVRRVGKTRAGRLLDGSLHDGMPA